MIGDKPMRDGHFFFLIYLSLFPERHCQQRTCGGTVEGRDHESRCFEIHFVIMRLETSFYYVNICADTFSYLAAAKSWKDADNFHMSANM